MHIKDYLKSSIYMLMLITLTCNSSSDIIIFSHSFASRENLRILILGNSITGAPSFKDDWQLGHGLAASTPDSDYVHILYNYLKDSVDYEPTLLTVHATEWEKKFADFDLTAWDTLRSFKPDLILIRLGDNIRGEHAVEGHLWEYFDALISFLAIDDSQVVFCTSSWYPNKTVNAIMKTVCQKRHVSFIDISNLYKDKLNHASSERPFENPYEGSHPGDRGMREIAEIIWNNLSIFFTSG